MVDLIIPKWPVPGSVVAFSTTRSGGYSRAPYDSLNLGTHVGDDDQAVASNRAELAAHLPQGTVVEWLSQVHGSSVVQAGFAEGEAEADGVWCAEPGHACAIMTADCLPVLFSSTRGDCVAAAHAGWRGLAGGVLEATLQAMPCVREDIMAWLGPCIGPDAFEVGVDVRDAFLQLSGDDRQTVLNAFAPHPELADKFYANLHSLARARLRNAGVSSVYTEPACTYSNPARFFSYRRDGQTGRMATLITLRAAS